MSKYVFVVFADPHGWLTSYDVAPATALHDILAVVELLTALTETVTDPGDALLELVDVEVGDEFAGTPLDDETL